MLESQSRTRSLAARTAAARTRRAGALATGGTLPRPRVAQAIDPVLRDRVLAEMQAAGGAQPAGAAAPAAAGAPDLAATAVVRRRWRVQGSALFPGQITEIR